jgi:HD-GYP domain-containing protein (c-di-GMP phosphodiesterase class II)
MAILDKSLVPIHPLSLVPGYSPGTDVYLWNEERGSTVKYLGREQIVTEAAYQLFSSDPNQKVFITHSSLDAYYEHLFSHLDEWIEEARVPRLLKTAVVAECLHTLLQRGYSHRSLGHLILASWECAQRLVRYVPKIQMCGRELQRTLRHDSSYVSHAVNSAMYFYLIAKPLGFGSDALIEMCAGAMLHDVGKIDVGFFRTGSNNSFPASKDWTDRSTRTHPIDGFRRLCHESNITETQLMMCYQHHERIDGQGFPVGLLGNELIDATRILAVVNRYDRLTSQRSNRQPITRLAALRVMDSERNTLLDSEYVRCMDRIMSKPSSN